MDSIDGGNQYGRQRLAEYEQGYRGNGQSEIDECFEPTSEIEMLDAEDTKNRGERYGNGVAFLRRCFQMPSLVVGFPGL